MDDKSLISTTPRDDGKVVFEIETPTEEVFLVLNAESAEAVGRALQNRWTTAQRVEEYERTAPPLDEESDASIAEMRSSGLTHQEIADSIGVSEATVRRRLHKARTVTG